eukprot:606271_1
MSELQPSSNSQQVVFDLTKRLRHAFGESSNSADVSLNEFKSTVNQVFTNAPTAKLEQIFGSFDEESKGTINWYNFLNSPQLSRVLLSLHDDSISQISLLQRTSADTTGSSNLSLNQQAIILEEVSAPADILSPPISAPCLDQRQSHESDSVASLEHEVQEKHAEIVKLREWITNKGLPAQNSVSQFEQRAQKLMEREGEMVDEMKRYREMNESLKAQNAALQKEHNQLHSQHTALKNEHMSFKLLCTEIQRKYDECLELYKQEKDQIKALSEVNHNLNKLKDQYERVNDDQNVKIQTYKQKTDDLREKCGILEMYIGEVVADNENLQQMLQDVQTGAVDANSPPEKGATRTTRALSSVNENSESSLKLKTDAKSSDSSDLPSHASFQPSMSFKLSKLDDIVRRYSVGSAQGIKGGHQPKNSMSLLTRIRSSKQINFDPQQQLDFGDPTFHNMSDSVMMDDIASLGNMGGSVSNMGSSFRRRKRTISILSIPSGFTPRGRKLSTQYGASGAYGMIADNLEMENDEDGQGYADAAYEEFGDMNEMDQLQEITEQLRVEIQEEMEEELEAQIKNKYDLKMLKLDTTYNEKLMLLHVEIDRLKSANKKQLRQMKILERGGSISRDRDANALQYVDDQKTNEEMDDDMDDLGGMSMEDDSDETFDDTAQSESSGEDHWSRREEHGRNDEHEEPLLSEHYDEKKKHKHRKKKKKDKHKKRKKKMGEKAHKDMQKGRFCCTSLWKDYTKIYDEDVASSDHGVLSKEKKKRKKEKKKRRKKEEKKEIVTESHEIDVRINNDENMGFGTDELNDENIEELTKEEEVMTMNDLQMELMKHNEEKEIEIVTHDEENSNKKNRDLSFMDDMVDALKEKSNVEEQEQVVEENSNTENVVSAGNGLVGDASGGVEATQS